MRAWYVLPEIIKRPVIFCLWGLTGTGKTQLTLLRLGTRLGRTDVTSDSDDNLNTDVQPTNAEAEALLAAELARAATLLQEHGTAFRQLVRQLLADGAEPAATFGQVTGLAVRVDDAQGDANGP